MSTGNKAPPPPPSTKKRRGRDPNSGRVKTASGRTQSKLSESDKAFRDGFVTEYLIDFNQFNAFCRACARFQRRNNGTQKTQRNRAWELRHEPYVSQQIQQALDDAKEANLINRNRILGGLIREANLDGYGAQHGARVSAWLGLAKITGNDSAQVDRNLASKGGILVVPATQGVDDWEKRAANAQAQLKKAVRE